MLIKYAAVFILLFLSACGSAPVYQLIPVTEGGIQHSNRSLLSVEDENAKTILNFDAQAGEYFSFFVIIENKSDSSVTVYPEDFYSETYAASDSLETGEPIRFYAYNPEYQLATIDKEMADLNSEKNFNDGLNCFLLGVVIVSDIADAANGEPEEGEEFKEMVFDKVEQDEINYEEEMYALESEREHWQYEALRTTTLKPGEKMSGVFYLPIYKEAERFRAVIPVGDKEYVYNYKQEKQE